MTAAAVKKEPKLSDAQKFVLFESVRIAYGQGWKGRLSERTAPELVIGTQPTFASLVSKGMAEVIEEPDRRWRRPGTYKVTKAGVEIAEAEIKNRGIEHPRDRFLAAEEVRLEREREAKEMRERVATALAGLKLPREGYMGQKEKPLDLAKEIRSEVFPRIELADLDLIIKHLTK